MDTVVEPVISEMIAAEQPPIVIDNETGRDIEVYGLVGSSPVLFGIADAALPSRIAMPSGLHNRIEIVFHIVGTERWLRSRQVKVESRTDYTVRISPDPSNSEQFIARRVQS